MTEPIQFFNPTDQPYGPLSNNYRQDLRVGPSDNRPWASVSSFIYGSLLEGGARNVLRHYGKQKKRPKKSILETFNQLLLEQDELTIIDALQKALPVKFKNPLLVELLLATENAPIIYISGDAILGNGPDGQGQNRLGKALVQLRHRLRLQQQREAVEEQQAARELHIYRIYQAIKILEHEMNYGSGDLSRFEGRTAEEIVEDFGLESFGRPVNGRPAINITDQATVWSMFQRDQFPEIKQELSNPGSLVLIVRKTQLRGLRHRLLREKNDTIFDMYLNYRLGKDYPALDHSLYEEAKKQHLATVSWSERQDLQERVVKLYEAGMLSNTLTTQIEQALSRMIIPTEREVQEVLQTELPIAEEHSPEQERIFQRLEGEPVVFYPFVRRIPGADDSEPEPFQEFSPLEFTGLLHIDGLAFPTMSHYILARLMENLKDLGNIKFTSQPDYIPDYMVQAVLQGSQFPLQKLADMELRRFGIIFAHRLLLDNPDQPYSESNDFTRIQTIEQRFHNQRHLQFGTILDYTCRRALAHKMMDVSWQSLLMATGQRDLLYTDWEDTHLGTGPIERGVWKGYNLTGRVLMQIRAVLYQRQPFHNLNEVTEAEVSRLIQGDPFMTQWVKSRVDEMGAILQTMRQHLIIRQDRAPPLNAEFAKLVYNTVYYPCTTLIGLAQRVTVTPPDYFVELVRQSPYLKEAGANVIRLIWERIAVLIYFMIEMMKPNATLLSVKDYLAHVELKNSRQRACQEVTDEETEPLENCIISALVNVLRRMCYFNEQINQGGLDTEDVQTAVAIILGQPKIRDKPLQTLLAPAPDDGPEEDDQRPIQPYEFPEPEAEDADDTFYSYGDDLDFDDQVDFGLSNASHQTVKDELMQVCPSGELDIFPAFTQAVQTIKLARLPRKKLLNRINFFATTY